MSEPRPCHVAAITGASSGLGLEFANQLAARGVDLFLIARREEKLQANAAFLRETYGVHVDYMVADLSRLDDVQRVEQRLETLTDLEYLINNAGFGGNQAFPDINLDVETAMIQVHCLASMRLCRAALIPMTAKKSGRIINVASAAGFMNGQGSADYSATKAFLISFSKSLQCDVLPHRIRVQALCPGFIRTTFFTTDVMKNSPIPQKVPPFLWQNVHFVIRTSLSALERPAWCYRVICIPSLLYKTITFFASEWMFAPLRILFSRGKIR